MGILKRAWRQAVRDAQKRSTQPPARRRSTTRTTVFPGDPAMKRLSDPNLALYIIGFEDPEIRAIKIGVSNNLRKRLATLQTGCPWRLEIKAAVFRPDAYGFESWLHEHFAPYRIRSDGEWFLPPEGSDPVEWVSNA